MGPLCVAQAGIELLELSDPLASASQVQGLRGIPVHPISRALFSLQLKLYTIEQLINNF